MYIEGKNGRGRGGREGGREGEGRGGQRVGGGGGGGKILREVASSPGPPSARVCLTFEPMQHGVKGLRNICACVGRGPGNEARE